MRYFNGDLNDDLEVINKIVFSQKIKEGKGVQDERNSNFEIKMKLDAAEKRMVPINGIASGPYKLYYFDGNRWNKFYESKNGRKSASGGSTNLCWWDVTKLHGYYTVLLVVENNGKIKTAIQDVYIGELFKPGKTNSENLVVHSPYRRAELFLATNSFTNDTVVSVLPKRYKELEILNTPAIGPVGPLVSFRPSPYQFPINAKPTLRYSYTFDEVTNQKLTLDNISIYGLGKDGNLQRLNTLVTYYTTECENCKTLGESGITNNEIFKDLVYQQKKKGVLIVQAPVGHFSDFVVLTGKEPPKVPTIDNIISPVKVKKLNISGKADCGFTVECYVDDDKWF